jgi:hypothetical protein
MLNHQMLDTKKLPQTTLRYGMNFQKRLFPTELKTFTLEVLLTKN